MSAARPRAALLSFDSWSGRGAHKVWVVGETTRRYRIMAREGTIRLRGGRLLQRTDGSALVPKYAVRFEEPAEAEK